MKEMQETQAWSLGQEDPPEKEMAAHYSILAWKIPWTEESGGLHSMGWHAVRHDGEIEQTHTWEVNKLIHTKCLEQYIEYSSPIGLNAPFPK